MLRTKLAVLGLFAVAAVCSGMNCIPPELQDELERVNCPNPSVTEFTVEVVSKSGSSGTVRFSGTVRNLGLQTFDSSEGQQAVQLYGGNTLLKQVTFVDLEPLESVMLTHDLAWNSSSEFIPDYQLIITYDPDITLDANPDNDDCITTDNSATLTGTQINDIFRAAE